jgi:hypothetical protein
VSACGGMAEGKGEAFQRLRRVKILKEICDSGQAGAVPGEKQPFAERLEKGGLAPTGEFSDYVALPRSSTKTPKAQKSAPSSGANGRQIQSSRQAIRAETGNHHFEDQ